jgi:predicted permease
LGVVVVAVVAVCVVLAVLAFLVPRFSRHPERGTQRSLGAGARAGGTAPGILGRLFSKPFHASSRAVSRSGAAGRRSRGRMPF